MNRIDQLLQQMIAETSQQVLPTVYSATMLAGLQELQGLTAGIEAQRAFAHQPAPAAPEEGDADNAPWMSADTDPAIAWRDGWDACRAAMLAAAPAAPVAQEPVAWQLHLPDGRVILEKAFPSWADGGDGYTIAPLYTAPPAAEQPDAWTPSVADYDRSIHRNPDAAAWADLFVATFPGLADKHDLMLGWFANAMMAMHDFLKAEQPDTVSDLGLRHTAPWDSARVGDYNAGWNDRHMAGMRDGEQPDTVAVPRDVLRAYRESLADGLETVGSAEAEWSTKDRALVASIDALLAGGAK